MPDGWPPVYDGATPRAGRYRGVDMKSQTEIARAMWADATGEKWTYEPRLFGEPGDRYKVDWYMQRSGFGMYEETKPDKGDDWLVNNRGEVNTWLRRMEIIRRYVAGAVLAVVPWGMTWTDPEVHHPRLWLLNLGRGWLLIDDRGWPGPAKVTPWEMA